MLNAIGSDLRREPLYIAQLGAHCVGQREPTHPVADLSWVMTPDCVIGLPNALDDPISIEFRNGAVHGLLV
jgi:hypothetical protein